MLKYPKGAYPGIGYSLSEIAGLSFCDKILLFHCIPCLYTCLALGILIVVLLALQMPPFGPIKEILLANLTSKVFFFLS